MDVIGNERPCSADQTTGTYLLLVNDQLDALFLNVFILQHLL
jgi:hypothetical protein